MRKIVLLPLLTAACVAPTQGTLNQAIFDCNNGNPYACEAVPALNAQVQQENVNNQVAGGVAAGLVGAAVIGGALASGPGWRGRGPGPGPGGPGFRPPPRF